MSSWPKVLTVIVMAGAGSYLLPDSRFRSLIAALAFYDDSLNNAFNLMNHVLVSGSVGFIEV